MSWCRGTSKKAFVPLRDDSGFDYISGNADKTGRQARSTQRKSQFMIYVGGEGQWGIKSWRPASITICQTPHSYTLPHLRALFPIWVLTQGQHRASSELILGQSLPSAKLSHLAFLWLCEGTTFTALNFRSLNCQCTTSRNRCKMTKFQKRILHRFLS